MCVHRHQFVSGMVWERGGLPGRGWKPVVRPDCRSAGWRASHDASDAARHQTDLCCQNAFNRTQMTNAVFACAGTARPRQPAEINLI